MRPEALVCAKRALAHPVRGQLVFLQFCSACHNATPGDPIEPGAGNTAAIRDALNTVPDMQFLRALVDNTDIGDLADFLAVTFNVAPPPPPSPPPEPPARPPPATTPAKSTVVEYFHAQFGHYFTTNFAAEIAALDAGKFPGWVLKPSTVWVHEADAAFWVHATNVAGACPAGTNAVYRLYNNGQGGAPNHRYTIDPGVRTEMIGKGWIPEGFGPVGVGFCAPA